MGIVPDTKDWTWVLQRPCPDCRYEAATVRREGVPALIGDVGDRWVAVLDGPGDVRERSSPDTWSPLEYGCHVRDVFRLFDQRLGWMLTDDDPLFPNWNQDETAVADRYGEQDPQAVAAELHTAAGVLAGHFAQITDAQWPRVGRRSDGARFTVESFARYLLHDPIHHLWDVTGHQWGEGDVGGPAHYD